MGGVKARNARSLAVVSALVVALFAVVPALAGAADGPSSPSTSSHRNAAIEASAAHSAARSATNAPNRRPLPLESLVGHIVAAQSAAFALLCWIAGALWRRHVIGRALVAVVTPILVALVFIAFARPDLFPTNVVRRRALLARVGPPRVVVGAEVFEPGRGPGLGDQGLGLEIGHRACTFTTVRPPVFRWS